MLADLTGKNMSTQLHDIYFNALVPLGIDNVNKVLLQFVEEFKFPSVVEIRSRLGFTAKEPDDEEKARLLTVRVVEAIGKFGWPNPVGAEKWFGPDDWEIVTKYRPWPQICNIEEDELQTFNSQFREFAKAYMHNKKYENHLALTGKANDLVKSLLDSKIQRQIDEIPF